MTCVTVEIKNPFCRSAYFEINKAYDRSRLASFCKAGRHTGARPWLIERAGAAHVELSSSQLLSSAYYVGSVRYETLLKAVEPVEDTGLRLPEQPVVFATGGARRLTAHLVSEIAASSRPYSLPELAQWCDGPFGFFGHSMGGIVAYELTGELLRRGRRAPSWLGVSACVPPAIQARSEESPPEPGADETVVGDRLRAWLAESGHTPDQLLADRNIWEMFGPMFQADFRLVDSWRPDRSQAALPVPLTAFGGSEDPLVRAEDLRLWGEQSQRFLGEQVYPGDHFYVGGHRRQVIRQIVLSVLWAHNEGK